MSDTPRMDLALRKAQEDCTESYLLTEGLKLERELNAANERINRLTAKVAQLYEGAEEKKQRIKRMEDRIRRASIAFFEDGSDASVASGMLAILEEERRQV